LEGLDADDWQLTKLRRRWCNKEWRGSADAEAEMDKEWMDGWRRIIRKTRMREPLLTAKPYFPLVLCLSILSPRFLNHPPITNKSANGNLFKLKQVGR
jgi:hypothetical protein